MCGGGGVTLCWWGGGDVTLGDKYLLRTEVYMLMREETKEKRKRTKKRGERVCQASPRHRCCMLIATNPNKMGVGTGEKFSIRPEIPIYIPIYRETGFSDRTASPEILFPDCHTHQQWHLWD